MTIELIQSLITMIFSTSVSSWISLICILLIPIWYAMKNHTLARGTLVTAILFQYGYITYSLIVSWLGITAHSSFL